MKRSYTKKQKKLIYTATLIALAVFLLVELIAMIPGVPFNGWSDIGAALGLTSSGVIPEGELEGASGAYGTGRTGADGIADRTAAAGGDSGLPQLVRSVLANGLGLLGVAAPEKM